MAKSYVRISREAKDPDSEEYTKAIAEFVRKMGGTNKVFQAISEYNRNQEAPEIEVKKGEEHEKVDSLF